MAYFRLFYRFRLSLFWLGLVLVMVQGATAGEPVAIVADGQSTAQIVISGQPTRMAKFAALELQSYIEKLSGANLPIVSEPGDDRVHIYVGKSVHTERLGIAVDELQGGAFRMVSGLGWLALLGPDADYAPPEPWGRMRGRAETERVNREWQAIAGEPFGNPFHWHYMHYHPKLEVWEFDDAGTLNAVYAFLRDLGVRWYAPGELGEVVPRVATIELPQVDRVVEADFPVRNLRYGYAQHGLGEVGLWNFRLGFNPGHRKLGHVQAGHGLKWVLLHPDMYQAHPEFYALRNGVRDTVHPCLSSEGLFDKHLIYIRAMLDHYDEPMVNVDMPDGFGGVTCECDRCQAQLTPERGPTGRKSDYVWSYIDRLAREIHRSHPGRMIGALSYSAYREPPLEIEQMSPNLAITECRWRSNFHDKEEAERSRNLRQSWLEKLPSGEYYIWDYYLHSRPGSRGIPAYFPELIAGDLRELRGDSQGDMIEIYQHQEYSDFRPIDLGFGYDPLAVMHLNVYVTAQFLWDADTDLEALLDEYYTLYYGPAADEMREFIEYSQQNWHGMRRDAARIDGALQRLAAAQQAVDPDSVYGQRVERVAEYVSPLHALSEQLQRARVDVPRARVLPFRELATKDLDGRLDDERYWPAVRTLPLVDVETGAHPPRGLGSWVRVFRSGGALYFGIRCSEPDMANLNRGVDENGKLDIRAGDFVEVLIETTSHSYYRITISPDGVLFDVDCGDGVEESRWVSHADVAVHHGDDYWSVELRLPLAGDGARVLEPLSGVSGRMPSETYPWYFNVGRQRVRDGSVERLAYAPTGSTAFDVLDRFAELWSR